MGEVVDHDVTIHPRLYNKKLGWEIAIKKKPRIKPEYADPGNVAKIPKILEGICEDHLSLKPLISDPTQRLVGPIFEKHGMAGQEGEVLRIFANGLEELATIGPAFANSNLKSNLLILQDKFFKEQTKQLLAIQKGISFKTLCETVSSTAKYGRKRQIGYLQADLIAYVKKNVPAEPLDPLQNIKDDINVCRITDDIAYEYLQTITAGIRKQRVNTASGLWTEAALLPQYQTKSASLLKVNPWAYQRKVICTQPKGSKKKKCPTCVLSPEQTMAVLMDLYHRDSPAFLDTLAQFTLGARPFESSAGQSKQHREVDQIEFLRISGFRLGKRGFFKLGKVTISCQKTIDSGIVERDVDLTPFAYSFWYPIVKCFRRLGLKDAPIHNYSYAYVSRLRRECYRRLGIIKYFAVKLGVDESKIGRSVKATADLGRHSHLTALYYHCVKTLDKPKSWVREQAGHEEGTKTLDNNYIGKSTPGKAKKYLYMQAPTGLSWDPHLAKWKIKAKRNRSNSLAAYQKNCTPQQKAQNLSGAARRKKKIQY